MRKSERMERDRVFWQLMRKWGGLTVRLLTAGLLLIPAGCRLGTEAVIASPLSYIQQEKQASASRLGVWQGKFIAPWDWRRGKRLTAAKREKGGRCLIKGNISRGGRIYHMPGGQYYSRTKITRSKGERWFCSEAAARAAGWRRSKR